MKWVSFATLCCVTFAAPRARADDKSPADDTPSKLPAVAATVLALAGGAFGVYAYGKAHDAAEPVPFAASRDIYDAEAKRVRRWNAGLIVGAGVGVFSAIVSGYLWHRALRAPRTKIEVTADDDSASISLGRSF